MLQGTITTSERADFQQFQQDSCPPDIERTPSFDNAYSLYPYPAVIDKLHEPQDGGAVGGEDAPPAHQLTAESGPPDSRPNFMTSSAAVSILGRPGRKRASDSMCTDDSTGTSLDLSVYSDFEDEATTARDFPSAKKKSMRRNGSSDTIGDGLSKSPGTARKLEEQTAKQTPEDFMVYKACAEGAPSSNIGSNFASDLAQLSFRKPPGPKLRPSYSGEGSRGAIKTADGEFIDININLGSDLTDPQEAVVFAGCLDDKNDTPHLHFSTNGVGDHPSYEYTVANLPVVAMRRKIPAGQSTIKMDIGIRRLKTEGERVSKLNRKCRVFYRLCIVKRAPGMESSWTMVGCAQLVTGIITCEQPMGAPVITEVSIQKCGVEGGATIAGKGRNFQSRSNPPDVTVVFEHPNSQWKDYAEIHHNVTTKESIAFKVPTFRPLTDEELNMTEIPVSIVVTVDKRSADSISFTYVIPKASGNLNNAAVTSLVVPTQGNLDIYLSAENDVNPLIYSPQDDPQPSTQSQFEQDDLSESYPLVNQLVSFLSEFKPSQQLGEQPQQPMPQYQAIQAALKDEQCYSHCSVSSGGSSNSGIPLFGQLPSSTQPPVSTRQQVFTAQQQVFTAPQQVSSQQQLFTTQLLSSSQQVLTQQPILAQQRVSTLQPTSSEQQELLQITDEQSWLNDSSLDLLLSWQPQTDI